VAAVLRTCWHGDDQKGEKGERGETGSDTHGSVQAGVSTGQPDRGDRDTGWRNVRKVDRMPEGTLNRA